MRAPLVRALRPLQWVKNLVIAGPLLFVPEAWTVLGAWAVVAGTILAFCALSSATYLINDLLDRETDLHHPAKALRPIAAGTLRPETAQLAALILALFGLALLALVDRHAGFPFSEFQGHYTLPTAALYLLLTLAYTLWLKHVVILDVIVIALGFVLRAVAGGMILRVTVSPWLLLCTFLLMLMVALGKRRWESDQLEAAHAHRPTHADYTVPFIDQLLGMVAAMTVTAYAFYTFNNEHVDGDWLMLTIPNVLYGVGRYLALIQAEESLGLPSEAMLRDRPLLICVGLWIIECMAILAWKGVG